MTNFQNAVDAISITGEVDIPLVILKRENLNGSFTYSGFIPGFMAKTLSADNYDDCKKLLKEFLMEKLKRMRKDNDPFPFFPTETEIRQDYDDVFTVDFVKVKSDKRKS